MTLHQRLRYIRSGAAFGLLIIMGCIFFDITMQVYRDGFAFLYDGNPMVLYLELILSVLAVVLGGERLFSLVYKLVRRYTKESRRKIEEVT